MDFQILEYRHLTPLLLREHNDASTAASPVLYDSSFFAEMDLLSTYSNGARLSDAKVYDPTLTE